MMSLTARMFAPRSWQGRSSSPARPFVALRFLRLMGISSPLAWRVSPSRVTPANGPLPERLASQAAGCPP